MECCGHPESRASLGARTGGRWTPAREGEGHGREPGGAMCYFSSLSLAPASLSMALEFLSPPLHVRFPLCFFQEMI